MILSAIFEISAAPDRVAVYLAEPRHLVMANHEGPLIERSDPPTGPGSWAVLQFDQIRTRIEYTAFDRDLVVVDVSHVGFGSRNMRWTSTYRLEATATGGTRVTFEMSGPAGAMTRWLSRLTWPLTWRRVRDGVERGA